jgi:hypothetical protein
MKNAVAIRRATELVPALKLAFVATIAYSRSRLISCIFFDIWYALSFARPCARAASAEPETLMVLVRICV